MSGRRNFLALTPIAGLAAAMPLLTADDAELLSSCGAFLNVDREIKTWAHDPDGEDEEAFEGALTKWYASVEFITKTQPVTPRGVQAKIRAAYVALETTDDEVGGMQPEEALAFSALRLAMEGTPS